MKYLSVCSGIEAATLAWKPLGWEAAGFSEIEPFPRAVLKHHYPTVPLHGDFMKIRGDEHGPIDLVVGGTPCQAFSLAGLRKGLQDPRGNLALGFLGLVDRVRPRWVVWENVPGVLSSVSHDAPDPRPPQDDLDSDNGPPDGTEIVVEDEYDADEGHALACFLAGLSELGYGWAYRVLDAQHFGVPQRRRRVFVVGYIGDWRRAAAVLFEPHCLSGNPAPRRGEGKGSSVAVAPSLTSSGRDVQRAGETRGQDPVVAVTLAGGGRKQGGYSTDDIPLAAEVCATLDANFGKLQGASGQDANHGHSHLVAFGGGNTSGPIEVATALKSNEQGSGFRMDFDSETMIAQEAPVGFNWRQDPVPSDEQVGAVDTADMGTQAVAYGFSAKDHGADAGEEIAPTLRSMGHDGSHAKGGGQLAVAQPIPFDTTQITHPENRSNPQPGDNSPTLAKGAHAPAIAFAVRGRDEGAQPEVHGDGDSVGTLRAAEGGSSRDFVAQSGGHDASPYEADASSILSVLRRKVGAEALAEWGSRILDPLQSPEVLQSWLHGRGLRDSSEAFRRWVDDRPLPREEGSAALALRIVWENGPDGRTSQGRGLAKQLAQQLGSPLPQLPHPSSQGVARTVAAVRRLTPTECERLMGMPDGYTAIPWRGKPADQCPDGPRYKALGNSMAIPVVRWIGEQIAAVEALSTDG